MEVILLLLTSIFETIVPAFLMCTYASFSFLNEWKMLFRVMFQFSFKFR